MRLRCKEIAKEIFAERASEIAERPYAERAALRGQRKDPSEKWSTAQPTECDSQKILFSNRHLQISSTHKLETQVLKTRAAMLAKARAFFAERNVLEVDCKALVQRAPIDTNIDVMEVVGEGYLHTSPEYAMKQLLAKGSGDIYYLGHVFRKEEVGPLHTPEFTMVEWYRLHFSFAEMMQETCEFLFLFFGEQSIEIVSYQEAFLRYVGIDPFHATVVELAQKAAPYTSAKWDRTAYLHLLLSHVIEPNLGQNGLTLLTDYPPNEAALACVVEKGGNWVAERFEVYFRGIELANGYHELANAAELRARFEAENQLRKAQGKEPYALDEEFLSAVEKLPPCCGVSVGFDRALLIATSAQLEHCALC